MRRLSWIITLPLLIVVVVFAVTNRHLVAFDFWPFSLEVAVPAFLPVLVSALIGFLVGGFIAWVSAGRSRSRARNAERDAEHLRLELARARREIEKQQKTAETAPPRGLPPAPPSSALPITRADA